MANIRTLKKDIHYISTELIMECLVADIYLKGEQESKLSELAQQVIEKRNELIQRINDFRKQPKDVKAKDYFKNIREEFHTLIKDVLDEINKLIK